MPTLSALIKSCRPGTQTSTLPTLLVAQPSQSLPGAWAEIKAVQNVNLQTTIPTLGNIALTTVLDSLWRHQSAHILYHVTLETAKPFDATMLFCDGESLALLDIVQSRHPSSES